MSGHSLCVLFVCGNAYVETHITFSYHRCVSARPDLQVGSWIWQFPLSIKPSKDNRCIAGRPVQFTLGCLTHYCISIWCSAVWSKDGMKAGILYFGGTLVVTTKPLHRPETPVGRRAEWDLSETFHCESNLFLHKQLLYHSAQPWSVCWASRYIYIYMYDIILYEGVFMKWWPVTVTPFQSCKCSRIVSLWVSVLQTQVA